MKVESIHAGEPAAAVRVAVDGQWQRAPAVWHQRRPQAIAVLDRKPEAAYHPARIGAETLLARHQWVAVMGIFHGAHFQIVPGVAWISPGGEQQLLGTLALRVPM